MRLPLIVIRPEPGCSVTVATARAEGIDAYGFPIFVVRPLRWQAPAMAAIDALLITSANAPRHAGPALTDYAAKPAYAVGAASAAAARDAGLAVCHVGMEGVAETLRAIAAGHRRLLWLAGAARGAPLAPPGVQLIERAVYTSDGLPMPVTLARLLGAHALGGAVIALHSPRAAAHFAAQCAARHIPRARLHLAALSPAVAAAAGDGWASVESAEAPCDAALLALAGRIFH